MNAIEWQQKAESVLESANIEDVRVALIARLEDRYGISTGVLPLSSGNLNYLSAPLLGVTATDAQRLAAFKYLRDLHDQLLWTRRYFETRLALSYRGPRSFTRFADRLLRITQLCSTILTKASSIELRAASLAQRRSIAPPSRAWLSALHNGYFNRCRHMPPYVNPEWTSACSHTTGPQGAVISEG